MAESWQPFANWKTLSGQRTKIVTVQQIDREYQAESNQEKIRLFVCHHIVNCATFWVIRGGDCLPEGNGLVPGGHTTVHKQEQHSVSIRCKLEHRCSKGPGDGTLTLFQRAIKTAEAFGLGCQVSVLTVSN